jgi:hypothetical protein
MHNRTSKLSDALDCARLTYSRLPAVIRPISMMHRQHDILNKSELTGKKRAAVASLARNAVGVLSRRGFRIARALFLTAGLTALNAPAYAAPITFVANLSSPTGVETDRAGNVYVDSDAPSAFTTVLTKFTAAGTPVAQARIGGITVGNLGHVVRIPNSDTMLLLTARGQILIFSTDVKPSLLVDLSPLNFATTTALDVTLNAPRTFTLGLPTWGDIAAVWARTNVLYCYLSATTGASGGTPFVLRIVFDLNAKTISAKVVATSTGTTAGNVNEPRGIAVNSLGLVLTGFPFAIPNGGFADSLVAFTTSFPEVSNAATRPRFIFAQPEHRDWDQRHGERRHGHRCGRKLLHRNRPRREFNLRPERQRGLGAADRRTG